MTPDWPPDGPKMAPGGPKRGSGWAQKSFKSLGKINIFAYEGHNDTKIAQDGDKLAPRWPQEAPRKPTMALDGESLLTSNKKRGGLQSLYLRRDPKYTRTHAHPGRHLCPILTLQRPATPPLQVQGEGVRGRGKPLPEGEGGV